jgi:ribose 5-phosphate isomerase A
MSQFPIDTDALWASVSNRETKEAIAGKIVGRAKDGQVIGFGSGTTSMVCAIAFGRAVADGLKISAVVTSHELEWLCAKLSIPVFQLGEKNIDWCFDGADEVDPHNNVLKGRGGAMHRERQVFDATTSRILVADTSKDVKVLGEKFPAPVEVVPSKVIDVCSRLNTMGFDSVSIRTGEGKDGPVITESGNVIVDVVYRKGFAPEVCQEIHDLDGVFDVGFFLDYEFERLM